MPLFERLKRGLRPDAQTSIALRPRSTSRAGTRPASPAQSSASAQIVKSIPEQLWEEAYDKLRQREERLIEQYEATVSRPSSIEALKYSLEDIDKLAKSRGKLENVQYVLKLKSVVAAGLQTSREAVLAWTIVCSVLEPILTLSREATANRDGLRYIVEGLDTHNKLSSIRLSQEKTSRKPNPWDDLQEDLRPRIVLLYTKILHYLIQSKVYHQQSALKSYAKDSLGLYDWGKLLQDVKDAEKALDRDDALRKNEANTGNIQTLTDIARSKEDKECLRSLRATDPRDDKKRIELEKGNLLEDAYKWILDNREYKTWSSSRNTIGDEQNNLLWIRGNPGKGKTMLLCGIINELSKDDKILAYFFCQKTNPMINTAESVIRGLLYMLADTDPTGKVLSLLKEKYDNAGAATFSDTNSWIVLKQLFERTLDTLEDRQIWLVVDALDECDHRDRLIDLVEAAPKNVNWLVSSRNWNDIEEHLDLVLQGRNALSLELNADSVAKAVDVYIERKVSDLTKLKRLDNITSCSIRDYLSANADGTFLWVALVCRSLRGKQCTRFNILELVKKFQSDLEPMYQRIFDQIKDTHEAELMKRILVVAVTAFRPLRIAELRHLLEDTPGNTEYWSHMVNQSGFLTAQSSQVTFLHLSAKEFLQKYPNLIVDDTVSAHHLMYERSMLVLSQTLRRNPYAMDKVGCKVEDLNMPEHDPLASITYSCLYWPKHFLELWHHPSESHAKIICEQLFRDFCLKKYLYWLEALIWLQKLPHGMHMMLDLKPFFTLSIAAQSADGPLEETKALYYDALRFILSVIDVDGYPLQVYVSTLHFSPTSSPIREAFRDDLPKWLRSKHEMPRNWSPHAIAYKTLSMGSRTILSPDAKMLAVPGIRYTEIRSAITGAVELQLPINFGCNVAFTLDSRSVAVVTYDGRIATFNCASGNMISEAVYDDDDSERKPRPCLAFKPNGYVIHSHHNDLIYRDAELNLLHVVKLDGHVIHLTMCSETGRLAVITDSSLYMYDTLSWNVLWKTPISAPRRESAVFSSTGGELVGLNGHNICCWNSLTGVEIDHIVDDANDLRLLSLYNDSLYYLSDYHTLTRRAGLKLDAVTVLTEERPIESFTMTPSWLIVSIEGQIKFYDTAEIESITSGSELPRARLVFDCISPDGHRVAYKLDDGTVRLWDKTFEWQIFTPFLEHEKEAIYGELYLSNDDRLAIARLNGDVDIFKFDDIPRVCASHKTSNESIIEQVRQVVFSKDGAYAYYSWKQQKIMVFPRGGRSFCIDSEAKYPLSIQISDKHVALISTDNPSQLISSFKAMLRVQVWSFTSGLQLLWSKPLPILTCTRVHLLFTTDSSHFGYFTNISGPPRLEVVETASGELVEMMEWQGLDNADDYQLSYSDRTGHFRFVESPIYPSDKGMELFVQHLSVRIDDELVLRLPPEYDNTKSRIRGNSLIHALSPECVSVLEFDVEEAVRQNGR